MKSLLLTSLVLVVVLVVITVPLGIYWMRGHIGPMDAYFDGRILSSSGPSAGALPEEPGELKVMAWNIHYGVGPEDDMHDRRTEAEVRQFLDRIGAVIRDYDPDVLLLQEVDFASDRTHRIDQLAYLQAKTGLPHAASVITWNPRYVPFPYDQPDHWLGRLESGQAVLAKMPLQSNRRVVLPQPAKNAFWYNWFYLHRSIQQVDLRLAEKTWAKVYNLHLEAFDPKNRELQAGLVAAHVKATRSGEEAMILGGDLNALPAKAAQKHDFKDEPELDYRDDETVAILRRDLGLQEAGADRFLTELSYPATAPNRRLDYLSASASWRLVEGGILKLKDPPSDHLPVTMTLRWRDARNRPTSGPNKGLAPEGAAVIERIEEEGGKIQAPDAVLPERLTGPVPEQGKPPRPKK